MENNLIKIFKNCIGIRNRFRHISLFVMKFVTLAPVKVTFNDYLHIKAAQNYETFASMCKNICSS